MDQSSKVGDTDSCMSQVVLSGHRGCCSGDLEAVLKKSAFIVMMMVMAGFSAVKRQHDVIVSQHGMIKTSHCRHFNQIEHPPKHALLLLKPCRHPWKMTLQQSLVMIAVDYSGWLHNLLVVLFKYNQLACGLDCIQNAMAIHNDLPSSWHPELPQLGFGHFLYPGQVQISFTNRWYVIHC